MNEKFTDVRTDLNQRVTDGPRDCGAFFLDVVGAYAPGRIDVVRTDAARRSEPKVERLIDAAWREQTALAARRGAELFNGRLARLADYRCDTDRLRLTLGEVSYREFVGTNLTNAHLRYVHGQEVLADPLGVSAAIVTADRFIVLARRSDRVLIHAGMIHPFGGMVEPDGPKSDPTAATLEELSEETGLDASAFAEPLCLGLVRDRRIIQPELIYQARADASVAELRAAQSSASDAGEHTDIEPVRDDSAAVVDFLRRRIDELTPVAMATLLLHGQHRWGSGWLTAARGFLRRVI